MARSTASEQPFLLELTLLHDKLPSFKEYPYTETEHYTIAKSFLNRHEKMMDVLLAEAE